MANITEPRILGFTRDRLQWLPVVAATVYAVGLFVNFGAILHSFYDISDWSAIFYLAQALPAAPHNAGIITGDLYMTEPLVYLIATHSIPGHRFLWELSPWIAGLIATGVLGRAVGKLYGRWAGWTLFIVIACAGPELLQLQFEWDGHASSDETICVLGAAAALVPLRGGMLGRSRWAWCGWVIVLAVLTAGGVADDPVFLLGGLVPLAVSGLVTAWLSNGIARRRTLRSIGAIVIGGGLGGELMREIATHDGFSHTTLTVTLVPYNAILNHVGLIGESLLEQLNGSFGSASLGFAGILALVAAAVIAAAAYAAFRLSRAQIRDLVAIDVAPRVRPHSEQELAKVTLIVFWVTGAVLLLLSFVFSSAVVDIGGQRYLVTFTYGIVVLAVIALAPHRRWRLAGAVGAAILVLSGAVEIDQHEIQNSLSSFPGISNAVQIEKWAKSQHLSYGFASYWESYPISWWTRSRPAVYPVTGCGTTVCAYDQRLTSWYAPKPHTRSFLIVDRQFMADYPSLTLGVSAEPPALGHPSEVANVGVNTIYVYDYDIASRFGPAGG